MGGLHALCWGFSHPTDFWTAISWYINYESQRTARISYCSGCWKTNTPLARYPNYVSTSYWSTTIKLWRLMDTSCIYPIGSFPVTWHLVLVKALDLCRKGTVWWRREGIRLPWDLKYVPVWRCGGHMVHGLGTSFVSYGFAVDYDVTRGCRDKYQEERLKTLLFFYEAMKLFKNRFPKTLPCQHVFIFVLYTRYWYKTSLVKPFFFAIGTLGYIIKALC